MDRTSDNMRLKNLKVCSNSCEKHSVKDRSCITQNSGTIPNLFYKQVNKQRPECRASQKLGRILFEKPHFESTPKRNTLRENIYSNSNCKGLVGNITPIRSKSFRCINGESVSPVGSARTNVSDSGTPSLLNDSPKSKQMLSLDETCLKLIDLEEIERHCYEAISTNSYSNFGNAQGTISDESSRTPIEREEKEKDVSNEILCQPLAMSNDSPDRACSSSVISNPNYLEKVNSNIITVTADVHCDGLESINWYDDSLLERAVQRGYISPVEFNEKILKNTQENRKRAVEKSEENSSVCTKKMKHIDDITSRSSKERYCVHENMQVGSHINDKLHIVTEESSSVYPIIFWPKKELNPKIQDKSILTECSYEKRTSNSTVQMKIRSGTDMSLNISSSINKIYENINQVNSAEQIKKSVSSEMYLNKSPYFNRNELNKISAFVNIEAANNPSVKSSKSSFENKLPDIFFINPSKPTSNRPEQIEKNVLSDSILSGRSVVPVSEKKSFFGLPSHVKSLIEKHKGINSLYDWQVECLSMKAVKDRKNLMYALPTSGGKTLVAEILILRELLCFKKNALLVLPYISIVQEKVYSMSQFAYDLEFFVEEYAAGKGQIPPKAHRRKQSLYIATMEKAHSLINSLIETKRLSELGLIIVDELHLLGEGDRGATLECLLTKVLFCPEDIHIVGMSATIGNLQEVANFLQAEIYQKDFRPVELKEYVKYKETVWAVNYDAKRIFSEARKIQQTKHPIKSKRDPDGVCQLVLEIVPKYSCLVFCQSKKNCENVASMIVDIMPRSLLDIKKKEREALSRVLRHEGTGKICPVLQKCVLFGVAYHHSGLTGEERKFLEDAYRAGILYCMCCTSTLAAGVNLPAKRVILRAPFIGTEFITLSQYKQMVGRAGRAGFDKTGESILICKTPDDVRRVQALLCSQMNTADSQLHTSVSRGLQPLIHSVIGLGLAVTRRQIHQVIACSLLHVQSKRLEINITELVDFGIQQLFKLHALKIDIDVPRSSNDEESPYGHYGGLSDLSFKLSLVEKENGLSTGQKRIKRISIGCDIPLKISRLGKACIKGPIDLNRALELYNDLNVAQTNLVLSSYLHILYLITPYDILDRIKLSTDAYYYSYLKLTSNDQKTAYVLGITEACIIKMRRGQMSSNVTERVFHRFYVTLILNDLWNHNCVWSVAEKYCVPRGTVQNLMMSAATFASAVLHFCEELREFWGFKSILPAFMKRLSHCCSSELLPLMDLPAVKLGRAHHLYNAGFKTLKDIANAEINTLVQSVQHLPRNVATRIKASAQLLLRTKAESLIEEADVMEGASSYHLSKFM